MLTTQCDTTLEYIPTAKEERKIIRDIRKQQKYEIKKKHADLKKKLRKTNQNFFVNNPSEHTHTAASAYGGYPRYGKSVEHVTELTNEDDFGGKSVRFSQNTNTTPTNVTASVQNLQTVKVRTLLD